MGRSPLGVAMGVSGDAHTRRHDGSFFHSHFQAPFTQLTFSPHVFVTHAVPLGSSQGAPWFGVTPGQFSFPTRDGEHPHTFEPGGASPHVMLHPGWLQHTLHEQNAVR